MVRQIDCALSTVEQHDVLLGTCDQLLTTQQRNCRAEQLEEIAQLRQHVLDATELKFADLAQTTALYPVHKRTEHLRESLELQNESVTQFGSAFAPLLPAFTNAASQFCEA